MARTTVSVEFVKTAANHYLRVSGPEKAEAREATYALLHLVLHEAGQYKGFRYLESAEAVRAGTADETRREYF